MIGSGGPLLADDSLFKRENEDDAKYAAETLVDEYKEQGAWID